MQHHVAAYSDDPDHISSDSTTGHWLSQSSSLSHEYASLSKGATESDQVMAPIDEARQDRPPVQAYGWWMQLSVVTALAMIIAATTFLSFLWSADRGSSTWRSMLISPYAAQSVTISAVVIRTALGILATISTSMLASIVLETRGVPLESLVTISLARYSNNGPLTLATSTPKSIGWLASILAMFLFGVTVASQFSSTLLFYDLTLSTVLGFPETRSNAYTFHTGLEQNKAIRGQAYNYYAQRPVMFGIFGEYSEPPEEVADDIDDTGVTIRALLPLASQADREAVHSFHGAARVIDSRVLCIRPEIVDAHPCEKGDGTYRLCGTLKRNTIPKNVRRSVHGESLSAEEALNQGPLETPFECALNTQFTDNIDPKHELPWSLCQIGLGTGLRLIPFLTNATRYGTEYGNSRDGWPGITLSGADMLVMNMGQIAAQFQRFDFRANGTWRQTQTSGDGPWIRQRIQFASTSGPLEAQCSDSLDISASWCMEVYPNTPISHLNITASTDRPNKEPVYVFDTWSNEFKTDMVRAQLGATRKIEAKRNILLISRDDLDRSLSPIRGRPFPSNSSRADPIYGDPADWISRRMAPDFFQITNVVMTPINTGSTGGSPGGMQGVDVLSATIFTQTITDTGSPARALQAFRTTQYRTIYYDHINAFEPSNTTADIVSFITVPAPTGKAGYITVMCLILAQCLIFFLLLWQFSYETQWSLLESGWSAIAQVASNNDAQTILQAGMTLRDGQVKDLIYHGTFPRTTQRGLKERVSIMAAKMRTGVKDLCRRDSGHQMMPDVRYRVKDGVIVGRIDKAE